MASRWGDAGSDNETFQVLLETALSAGEPLVTDAEVLQEICHRYAAIDRRDAIQPAFDAILQDPAAVLSPRAAAR